MDSRDAVSQRRADRLGTTTPLIEQVPSKMLLHSDAQALQTGLAMVTPPAALANLHQEALSYLDRYVQWLALELEYVETGVDVKRVEANNMVEENNVRQTLLNRRIANVKFIYNLGE